MNVPTINTPLSTTSRLQREATSQFILLLLLSAVLLGTKAMLLPAPKLNITHLLRWTVRVVVVSYQDVLFVAVLAVIFFTLGNSKFLSRWMKGTQLVVWTVVLFSAVYSIVSVPIFRELKVYLSWTHLMFLGNGWEMLASLFAATRPKHWLACLSVLMGIPTLHWVIHHCSHDRISRLKTWYVWPAGVVLLLYGVTAHYWISTMWNDASSWQGRVAASPHLRLIATLPTVWQTDPFHAITQDTAQAFQEPTRVQPNAISPEMEKPLNVVVIVLESVAAQYMQIYGAPHENTPYLARHASQSLIFENIYAQCPSSAKALVAMHCGVYPRPSWQEQTGAGEMPVPSIADVLAEQGYRTAFIHSGNWSWRGGDDFVRSHGFQHFQDARGKRRDTSWGIDDASLAVDLFHWVDAGHGPFLSVLWTIQTHHPYVVTGTERDFQVNDAEKNRYLNGIATADQLIETIWEHLERRGLADSTVLAIIGDHGEAFGQHNQRLHIFGAYEENVHIPLVIMHRRPDLPTGRLKVVGQQIDLPATLCHLLGVAAPVSWQGRSLLAEDRPPEAYFYTVWDPLILGVRKGNQKYLWQIGGEEALFNLSTDPHEQHNLASSHPQQTAELQRQATSFLAYQRSWSPPPPLANQRPTLRR